jgi:hypothetical protein
MIRIYTVMVGPLTTKSFNVLHRRQCSGLVRQVENRNCEVCLGNAGSKEESRPESEGECELFLLQEMENMDDLRGEVQGPH